MEPLATITLRKEDNSTETITINNTVQFSSVLENGYSEIISIVTSLNYIGSMMLSSLPNIREICFTDNVELDNYALMGCQNLSSIIFRGSAKITENCILGCENLTNIICDPTKIEITKNKY